MKSIKRTVRILAVAALVSAGVMARAEASTISIIPTATIVNPGDPFSVDIVLDGLTEAVGAASFTLNFNNLVTGTGSDTNPDNRMGDDSNILDLSCGFGLAVDGFGDCTVPAPNTFDYFVLADFTLDAAQLFDAQNSGGPFRLAQVSFLAGNTGGQVPLTLTNIVLSNFDGSQDLAAPSLITSTDDTITINQTTPTNPAVPEPTTMLLLGTGLGSLIMRRRRQQ